MPSLFKKRKPSYLSEILKGRDLKKNKQTKKKQTNKQTKKKNDRGLLLKTITTTTRFRLVLLVCSQQKNYITESMLEPDVRMCVF